VGTYAAVGYPDFAVRLEGEALQGCTVGSLDWSELRHYHYNVFEWRLADFDRWVKVRFLVDDQGEVDALSIPIEPEVENVTFTRTQPELSGELIARLVGEYASSVEGMTFTVTAQRGRIYVAQAGGPPEELTPYKVQDELVSFRAKRSRFEFVHGGETAVRLVLKTPFMTLDASRKG
jgi:hypothetical protein